MGSLKRLELRLPGRRRQPVPRTQRDHRLGLHGLDQQPRSSRRSKATRTSPTSRAPETLQQACASLFAASDGLREAFGQEVVDHYLNYADVELAAYNRAVTDWERFRGFERL